MFSKSLMASINSCFNAHYYTLVCISQFAFFCLFPTLLSIFSVCIAIVYMYMYIHVFPGKPAEDDVKLGSLKLKPNTKIMMMGTREESLVGNWDLEKLQLAE